MTAYWSNRLSKAIRSGTVPRGTGGAKYHSRKVEWQGDVFDSIRELRRYQELTMLEKAGEISDLRRQVKYLLIPKQKGGIRSERECAYIADFVYRNADGDEIVEDCKGYRTRDYLIKRKLMKFVHGIDVVET